MDEFITLLDNFWILRDKNDFDYFKIKRAIGSNADMKRFSNDFLGWKLIVNSKLIKMEKQPAEAEPFMGIQAFQNEKDYCLLCALLIYLNDIDDGRQFLLTELIESIEKIVAEFIDVDFTKYTDRKSLVRMLSFAQDKELLKISEGSLENVENDTNKEILYENTGISGYFALHHDRNISNFTSYHDFENSERIYTDKEKGSARINRVYRRLFLQPAMYWDTNEDMDSIYLKNQRTSISKYLDMYINGRLDIQNGSAFCMLSEENSFGNIHPTDKMISGLVLLICQEIRDNLFTTCIISEENRYEIELQKLNSLICDCRSKYKSGLSKEYREMSIEKLYENVITYMETWKMIERKEDEIYLLKDGIFKTSGAFPKDFECNNTEENE